MESYIPISFLNDFIFCPRSIYFHQLYKNSDESNYYTTKQTEGRAAHTSIDKKSYSSSKKIFQSLEIYSAKYNIGGKIDTFNEATGILCERKKRIKTIYDGYVYQLYAQYYCLIEMDYKVKKIQLYSFDDNKTYPILLPKDDNKRQKGFEMLIKNIHSFDLNAPFYPNINKCNHCIYNQLCDMSLC